MKHWKKEDFIPYIDIILDVFGTERIMFGSDWPVCLAGGDYNVVANITKDYCSSFIQNTQDKFSGLMQINFIIYKYGLTFKRQSNYCNRRVKRNW